MSTTTTKPSGIPDCNGGTPTRRVISPDQCPMKFTWCPKWQRVMRPLGYQGLWSDPPYAAKAQP